MIKIAVCDDNAKHNETIINYCGKISSQKNFSISVDKFNTGEDLLNYCQNHDEKFNIIFLDVEMGSDKKSGIETATLIRKTDKKSHIVFLTDYPKYMQDAFYVQASNYLQKPITYEFFESEFKRIYDLINAGQNNTYVVRTLAAANKPSEDLVLNLDEVLYFESHNNFGKSKSDTIIVTADNPFKNPIQTASPLSKIAEDLKGQDFITIIRGLLVNVNHISGFIVNSRFLKMDNGEELMYAKGTLKKIKEEFKRVKLSRW